MKTMEIKKCVFSFFLLLCFCFSTYGQNPSYSMLFEMASSWLKPFLLDDNSKGVIHKTVEVPTYHYSISSVFLKRKIAPGHRIVILDTKNNQRPILEGVVSYDHDFLLVTGIKYDYSAIQLTTTYGIFLVSNADNGLMVYKPKKAGDIRIVEQDVYFYHSYCHNCPVIVSLNGAPCVAVDGKMGEEQFTDYYAPISQATLKRIGYNKPFDLLMASKTDVRIKWKNGVVFSGDVFLEPNDNGIFSIYALAGNMKGFLDGYKEIKVREDNGSIFMELIDSPKNSVMKHEVLKVSDKDTISEKDYWNENVFFEKVNEVFCEYRNGDVFEGNASYKPLLNTAGELVSADVVFIAGTIRYANGDRFEGLFNEDGQKDGLYYYANGDRFEGRLKNKWGNLYFDGTTYLKSGKIMEGNYLNVDNLSDAELGCLKNCMSPSEATAMAFAFKKAQCYDVYATGNSCPTLHHFDANYEHTTIKFGSFLIYRKDKKCYYLLRGSDDNPKVYDKRGSRIYSLGDKFSIIVVAYTDDEGRHLEEVVLNNGVPDYITRYKYYSNHKMSSIKTQWLNEEKILKCNFFSDGLLRSAYEYQIGNGDKMVLRRSKEAHPSFGGYTSKLYDLNGNYERLINWDIGEHRWANIKVAIEPNMSNEYSLLDPMDPMWRYLISFLSDFE